MNTILISGTVRSVKDSRKLIYDLYVWGSKSGEPIQLVTAKEIEAPDYNELWKLVKIIAASYFHDLKFYDGAYTQFLDHIINKY